MTPHQPSPVTDWPLRRRCETIARFWGLHWSAVRRWCTKANAAGIDPSPASVHATRTETGFAVRVIRFSTETAIAASPC